MIGDFSNVLDVSPHALTVPDIDSYIGFMHTLFTLEDVYNLMIDSIDGEVCLTLDKSKGNTYISMFEMLSTWQKEAEKLKTGEITKEEYDQWRYTYPQIEAERTKATLDVLQGKKNEID